MFWNPKLRVDNAYAPFFRVNSVFWDPSIYGRYLVVAILATLALVLLGVRDRLLAAGIVAIVAIWVGLLFSFSQSSFAALIAGTLAAAAVIWRWRAAAALAALAVVLVSVGFATPQVRNQLLQESRAGLNSVTSDRAGLVGNGLRIAVDHPVLGVGTGSFKRAYAEKTGLKGEEPKKAASHSTPVTVVAETGVLGLVLLCWLGFVALATAVRSRGRSDAGRAALVAALTLGAIAVHSLFYNALFEDPTMWALLGLIALVSTYRPRSPSPRDRDLEARARARAAHRRRRVRLRRHDGAARRGGGRGALPRLLDRDALAAGGFAPDTLAREVREATGELGIPEAQLRVHDFDVRTFPERRQDILELLVGLWEELKPDAVFQPSHHDVHQDHQTIAQEGLRAFKRTTVLGYEIPWNNFDFSYGAYVGARAAAPGAEGGGAGRYASQQHRRYANPEYVWNLARVHGINVNREYAECFQVYRIVA